MTNPPPHLLRTLQAGLIAFATFAQLGPMPALAQQAGDLDLLNLNLGGFSPDVLATAVQPDGKIVVGGFFSTAGDPAVARSRGARFNADGTLDASFDPNVSVPGEIYCLAVQADGKVLIGGWFNTLQPKGAPLPITRNCIARFNADGTLDTGFDPNVSGFGGDTSVDCLTVQADGKILIGGYFSSLQPIGAASPVSRNYVARVNADGSLDAGFDPSANGPVLSLAVQSDNRVLLGGSFTTLQPNGSASATNRDHIARVNADGTLDTGFDPKANNNVSDMTVQADGKVLLSGQFTTLQPNGAGATTTRQFIARVNADGTLDTGFDPKANSYVRSIALQADGKVLLGGGFTTLQPNGSVSEIARRYIARVNADGTLDTSFDPKASSDVYSLTLQANGKVLIGGHFTSLQPNGAISYTARDAFARLLNDPATQMLSVPDPTQAIWTRGGSAPEVTRVAFDLSTDGGTVWTTVGTGTRIGISADWQRTALALPASGQLRVRGFYPDSSGLIEQVAGFGPDTDNDGLLDSWELTYWPTITGQSALDDSDHDGFAELIELAFGLNPTLPSAGGLPPAINEGGYLTMTITKQAGVTYEVHSAGSLLPAQPDSFSAASTTVLTNNATTLKVRDNLLTSTAPGRFMRVKVTAAP